jgi:hypothetical protein
MKKGMLFLLSFTSALLFIASCKHHPDEIANNGDGNGNGNIIPNPPDTVVIINNDPCDPDTVYFQNTILPLLISNCAMPDCHDAISHAEGVRLYDYSHIMQQVQPGSLNQSDLWNAVTETGGDMMPPADTGGPLSPEQMQAIQTWILQGAKNNSCTEDCDPTAGSFATNVMPIIELTCNGCHGGSNPSGNLSLETYDQVKASALDGSLMNSLHGINGVSLMPDNTTGLPDCYISQIQNWVNAGAPNN